jgi:hypothetical protein
LCRNALAEVFKGIATLAMRRCVVLFGFGYALIAVMSGWMPMMFMTRVRL